MLREPEQYSEFVALRQAQRFVELAKSNSARQMRRRGSNWSHSQTPLR